MATPNDASDVSTQEVHDTYPDVSESETLIRMLPTRYIDKFNGVEPGFYSSAYGKGLSTLRLERADQSQVDATLDEIFPGAAIEEIPALCANYVQAPVTTIRATAHVLFPLLASKISDEAVFNVIATPISPKRNAHADVEVATVWKPTPTVGPPISKNQIKKRLKELFGTPKPVPVQFP